MLSQSTNTLSVVAVISTRSNYRFEKDLRFLHRFNLGDNMRFFFTLLLARLKRFLASTIPTTASIIVDCNTFHLSWTYSSL